MEKDKGGAIRRQRGITGHDRLHRDATGPFTTGTRRVVHHVPVYSQHCGGGKAGNVAYWDGRNPDYGLSFDLDWYCGGRQHLLNAMTVPESVKEYLQ